MSKMSAIVIIKSKRQCRNLIQYLLVEDYFWNPVFNINEKEKLQCFLALKELNKVDIHFVSNNLF